MNLPAEERVDAAEPQLVDWRRLGRRLRLSAIVLGGLAVGVWVVVGLFAGGVELGDLPGYVGLAFGGMFVAELIFVGGSALRGMVRAGEHGERLAGGDVGLMPPQLRKKLFGDRS